MADIARWDKGIVEGDILNSEHFVDTIQVPYSGYGFPKCISGLFAYKFSGHFGLDFNSSCEMLLINKPNN